MSDMKRYFLFLLLLSIILSVGVFGCKKKKDPPQPQPTWSYDSNHKYPASMTAVVILPKDIQPHVGNKADRLAAFIDGECRGMGTIIDVNGKKEFFIMIHGTATEKGKIQFRYFSGLYAYYYKTKAFLTFKVDDNYGTADHPKILVSLQKE